MFVKSAIGVLASLVLGASPVLANDAVASTSVQITSSVERVEAPMTGEDDEFSELFASWGELGNGGMVTTSGQIIAA